MSHRNKTICFIYTDTIGLHNTTDNVSTKNLYNFARLSGIYYSIGIINNIENKYVENKYVSNIIKPNTIYYEDMDLAKKNGIEGNIIIQNLKDSLKSVDIIISCDISHHLKAIQVECFRTAISIDFAKYILIDTLTFGKENQKLSLQNNINYKNNISHEKLNDIKNIFILLYNMSNNIN